MKNEQLKKLELELSDKKYQVQEVEDKIQKLKNKIELPLLKEKFEGKFFKYRNGVSSTNRWWLFVHCKKVVSIDRFIVDTFEDGYNGLEFKSNSKEGKWLCEQIEISKEDYVSNLKKFKSTLNKLSVR